ncbi:hypothetical protein FD50_GL001118 [Liquorilactobacillus satsumensis DSM 16230 = JCM 12392]|uniref:Uncharacterized protein n=1 Tax=Liquorilactobacillus satsumensis DSM 16230 = JCM 12392 TaxID=1423801 RepID=A0A0R1V4T4_9LACO|nr:hypothetical protein FD50_GL001118 [Liquorilactobacillus satsumensis DSM 16230 = JCM 12392]
MTKRVLNLRKKVIFSFKKSQINLKFSLTAAKKVFLGGKITKYPTFVILDCFQFPHF